MEEKCEGIVIRCVNFGKSDRMLTVMTLQNGKISVSAKSARNSKNKNHTATNMFVLSQMVLFFGADVATLKSADIVKGFFNIASKLPNYYFACFAAELFNKAIEENQPESILFYLLYHTLLKLDSLPEEKALLVGTAFLAKFVAIDGACFDFSSCNRCGSLTPKGFFFSFDDGSVVCNDCSGGEDMAYFSKKQADLYTMLVNVDIEKISNPFEASQTDLYNIFSVLNNFIKYNYQITLKSLNAIETLLY